MDPQKGSEQNSEQDKNQEWQEATGPAPEPESSAPEKIEELDQYKGRAVTYSVDSGRTWLVGVIQQINFSDSTCLMLNASKPKEVPVPYIIRQEDLTKRVFRIRAALHEELRGLRLPDEHTHMLSMASRMR